MKNAKKMTYEPHIEPRSTWANPGILTIDLLKDWILAKLGYPLVTVELTLEQLNACIADGIAVYSKYAYTPEKYLIVNTKFYVPGEGIDLSENRIMSVKDLTTLRDAAFGGGQDMFFSPYAFFGQGGLGGSPFFNAGNVSPCGAWTTYQCAIEWWDLCKRMTGSNPDFLYDKITKKLRIMPEPRTDVDNFVLLTVNQEPPMEEYFGNEFCRRLVLAECKILLGTIRKKFSSVLLIGGGSIDTSIGDEGREEKQQAMEDLIKSESKGQFFVVC